MTWRVFHELSIWSAVTNHKGLWSERSKWPKGHANHFSKKPENLQEGRLSSTPSKCHSTLFQPTWSLPNDAFSDIMRKKSRFSALKAFQLAKSRCRSLSGYHLVPLHRSTALAQSHKRRQTPTGPRRKRHRAVQRFTFQQHNTLDNRLALEQIPECPRVAHPKPGLEAIWKSVGRPEDHGLPTLLIQSDSW